MFEGYGSYIRERDEDRVPTAQEIENLAARQNYIADRAWELLGTAKLAEAIQDDMTGFFGHEPNAIAMLLSQAVKTGDWKQITDRVNEIAKDVAAREWGRP
jgi:hypothetical protein